jgi:hypothetical protein
LFQVAEEELLLLLAVVCVPSMFDSLRVKVPLTT